MGSGVEDDETYENRLEDRLNRELGGPAGRRFEVLNFSQGGYTPIQKLAMLETRALDFRPDLVLYAATSHEIGAMFEPAQLQHLARYGLLGDYPYVVEAMAGAGVGAEDLVTRERSIKATLQPYAEPALTRLLAAFRELGESRQARTALLLVEIPNDPPTRAEVFDRLAALGRAAGLPVLDLQGAFADVPDRSVLWIAPWDAHTNATGHSLLADRLYDRLLEQGLIVTEPAPQP
jgi:hypothetical protein